MSFIMASVSGAAATNQAVGSTIGAGNLANSNNSGIQAAIANVASTNAQSVAPTPSYGGGGSLIGSLGNAIGGEQALNAVNANQTVGSTVGANQSTNIPSPTPVPVDVNAQAQPALPGSLEAVQTPPPPNLAPINPTAVSAPGVVAGVFGENTEGQYGRQSWNAQ